MSGLAEAPIGCVPIVWNNVDLPDLGPPVAYGDILDTLGALGYAGCQFGRGFPEGEALREELATRGLRLAEWYCSVPADADGPTEDAAGVAQAALERLGAAGGEVLVVAVDGSPERNAFSGRVPSGAPRWRERAFDRLASLLAELAEVAPDDVRVAFHPHTATWIESPDEVSAVVSRLGATGAGLCLDVGHYLVGGGDPVDAIVRFGSLVTHVHVKDVDPSVLARLRTAEIAGFSGAIRERLFTEVGRGALDLRGMVRALERVGYDGWLMVEQDSSWLPPAESAEVSGRALRAALAELGIGT